jgi:ABC-2 type transport system ATP-binding protein
MKQKLGLACALIHTPKVLFLDEPTNGVDPVSRRDFWRILYQLLRENVTIFISTAYLDEAERCGRVGLMHRGKLLAVETPDEVKHLMKGTILEVRSSEPRRATALLRKQLTTASASLFGDRIHLLAQQPDQAVAETERVLVGAGLSVSAVRTIDPSLEDVFISILADERKN